MEREYKTTEPFFLPGDERNESTAVLMVHGFTGSPSEFRRVGYFLNEMGYTVKAVRLPGHGTIPEDMIRTGWRDWYQHVLDSYDELAVQTRGRIVVMGHSMGGLLALKLASERQVDGIVSLATPIYLTRWKTALALLLQYFVRYIKKKPLASTLLDEACSYDKTPTRCVVSLRTLVRQVKRIMPEVAAPIYIGQGLKDRLVLQRSADYIHNRINSEQKMMKLYPQTSHGMLLDQERDQVYDDISLFIRSLQPPSYKEEAASELTNWTAAYDAHP
jgi:carboxylesterase